MTIRLQVTSPHRDFLGAEASKSFEKQGGTIGRSIDNDWVLPDPERFVSGRHATIDFQSGAYYLVDNSTNGVFINDSEKAVGRRKPQRLFNGDTIRIGEYRMMVEIDDVDELLVPDSLSDSVILDEIVPAEDDHEDLPDLLDAEAMTGSRELSSRLFNPEEPDIEHTLTGKAKVDIDASAIVKREDLTKPANEPEASEAPQKEPEKKPGKKPEKKPGKKSKPAPEQKGAAAPPPVQHRLSGAEGALLSFLRGLGMSSADLGNPKTPELMQNAGMALREFVLATMEQLQLRSGLKNTYRLEQTTIQAGRNNPLKFSASIDDAIRNLIVGGKSQQIPTVDSVRDATRDIKQHQEAITYATVAAFEEFTDRFAPDRLETRFNNSLKGGSIFSGNKKAKYWDMYRDAFEIMSQHGEGEFPQVFAEEFARAYDEYMQAVREREKPNR